MRTEIETAAPLQPPKLSRPVRMIVWTIRAPFVAVARVLYFSLVVVGGVFTWALRTIGTLSALGALVMGGYMVSKGAGLESYTPAFVTFGVGVAAVAAAHYFGVFVRWLAPR